MFMDMCMHMRPNAGCIGERGRSMASAQQSVAGETFCTPAIRRHSQQAHRWSSQAVPRRRRLRRSMRLRSWRWCAAQCTQHTKLGDHGASPLASPRVRCYTHMHTHRCVNSRYGRTETDRDGQRRTETDGQRRTETDRDGQRRTETDRETARWRDGETGTGTHTHTILHRFPDRSEIAMVDRSISTWIVVDASSPSVSRP